MGLGVPPCGQFAVYLLFVMYICGDGPMAMTVKFLLCSVDYLSDGHINS